MHIRFYDRGVDAKAATVRDPGTLGDIHDTTVQLLDDLGTERARDLQNCFRVGHLAGVDAREGAVHQIGAHLALQIVVAPIEQMLQDQHPQHDLRRRARAPAASTLRPARFHGQGHGLNHGLVLEQRIDLAQPVGPQFVTIGQQHFEQTPLALSTSDHARSFVA